MINNEKELFILLKDFIVDPDFNFVKILIPINIKNDSVTTIHYDKELKEFFRTYNDKYKNFYQVANNVMLDNIEYIEFKKTNDLINQHIILKYIAKDEFNLIYENIEFIGLPIKIIKELIKYESYKKFICLLKSYCLFDFFKFLNHIKSNNFSEKIIFNIFNSKISMRKIEIEFEITFEKEFKNKNEISIFINSFNEKFNVDSSYLNIINDHYSCNSLIFITNGKDKLKFVI